MVDDAKQKIVLVLNKILSQHYLGAESTSFLELRIERILGNTNIERDVFVRILENLNEKGVIVGRYSFWIMNKAGTGMKISYERDPKWDVCNISLPRNFRELAKEYLNEISNDKLDKESGATGILYINEIGQFWHGDIKDGFCYRMKTGRLAIMKYLIENRGYQPTKEIASAVGKTPGSTMSEIGKIKNNISNKLDLDDVIESEPGYRINPKYTVTIRYNS